MALQGQPLRHNLDIDTALTAHTMRSAIPGFYATTGGKGHARHTRCTARGRLGGASVIAAITRLIFPRTFNDFKEFSGVARPVSDDTVSRCKTRED